MNIKLENEAQAEGFEGDFLRYHDEFGKELSIGLWGPRYAASGVGDDKKQYMIYWQIEQDWNGEDESDACDWDTPVYVVDEDGKCVTALVNFGEIKILT